ncbi:MAG: hypothetical protein IJD77_05060 [Clostridia bacterium]|nr:hypothetical protein [Clostridia bacterium]
MKLKRALLSLCMALTFVVAFAFAGCSDCVTETIKEPAKPTRPNIPGETDSEGWTDNY